MELDKNSGWWLPDGEVHLPDWMAQVNDRRGDRLLYQGSKYRMVLGHVKERVEAVDIGAHVGLWSWQMAQDFEHVLAFEPMPAHAACWRKNMEGFEAKADLMQMALGAESKTAHLLTRTLGSSGDTGIEPAGEGVEVNMAPLDYFEIERIDLLKIDCEGFEIFILRGGVHTLQRCRPTVIVEQKRETGMEARYGIGPLDAVTFLEGLGARRRGEISGDYILSWD